MKRDLCTFCHRCKAPRGRDVPAALDGSFCDTDCPGYLADPQPPDRWPGEPVGRPKGKLAAAIVRTHEERRAKILRGLNGAVRGDGSAAHLEAAVEALAAVLATAWLVRVGAPYDGRLVEQMADAILNMLEHGQ